MQNVKEHNLDQADGLRGGLEAFEMDREDKPPYHLTTTELKLLGISGVCTVLRTI